MIQLKRKVLGGKKALQHQEYGKTVIPMKKNRNLSRVCTREKKLSNYYTEEKYHELCHEKTYFLHMRKYEVTAQQISTFVFATQTVQTL